MDERPLIVEERNRVRDRRGDLIFGRASRSALGTLVDHSSRCLRLIRLPVGQGAEAFVAARGCGSRRATAGGEISLTWDQGSEMARTTCWPACWSAACLFSLTRPVHGSMPRIEH